MAQGRRLAVLDARVARLIHYASLAGAGVVLLSYSRHQWFVQDDWAFASRLLDGDAGDYLRSYNLHWMTWPLLEFRAAFAFFSFQRYAPYLIPVVALHIVCWHLLWRPMLRVGSEVWLATALSGAFLFSGNAFVIAGLAVQVALAGSLAVGLAAILLLPPLGATAARPCGSRC